MTAAKSRHGRNLVRKRHFRAIRRPPHLRAPRIAGTFFVPKHNFDYSVEE
jgi:hypothetical protein